MHLKPFETSQEISSGMERLYTDSFPPEERRDWAEILRLTDTEPRFSMLGVYNDSDEPAGFITLWDLGAVVYGEHFAIEPSQRGGGLGGRAVEALTERLGDRCWVIEVEPPGMTPEAGRRISFYTRHGMILHPGYRYIQPSYGPELPEVELKLMTSRPCDNLEEAARLIHKHVYGKCI